MQKADSTRRLKELRSQRNAKLGALQEKLNNPPSPNNQSDIDIRNKALHLLQQVDPHEDVSVSYAQQARRESNPSSFQSYQNSAEALEREREANRRYSNYGPHQQQQRGDDLVDLLMPVVSCVSHACKVGIAGIAQQAAQGVSFMTREAEDRMFTGKNPSNMQGSFESVGMPTSYQGNKYSDIPEAGSNSSGNHNMSRAAGQKTGEHADILSC